MPSNYYSISTLHCARVPRKLERLAACVHPVKDRRGLWMLEEKCAAMDRKPCGWPEAVQGRCKTGFRRGFSQLTFGGERGEYKPSGFPTQSNQFPPGAGWARKRPVRRNYE
jgi:hypothetical protein